MKPWQQILVGFALLGTWATFAFMGKTPVEPLIDYIKLAGVTLGFVKVALINPTKDKAS